MSPTSRITGELAGAAIDALLNSLRSNPKHQKSQLFEHEDFLYLHLSLLRFPSTSRTNPHIIPLPHSLHPLSPSRTSLCLIAADESLAEAAKSTAAAHHLPFDAVISLSDLRASYRPFESRRKLCDSYDVFFADRRVVALLPRLIGSYFFKKRKIPIGINMSRPGWPEAVRRVCGSTLLFFGGGTSVGMKVGRVWMGRDEIVENLMAAVEGAVDRLPRKWGNVRCVYVKAAHSVSLPVYQVVPEAGMRIVVDGESGEEESGEKTKKRKARIHDADYVGGELVEEEEEEEEKVKEVKFDRFVELGDGGKMRKKRKARIHDVDYVGGELVEEEEEKEEKVKDVKFDRFVELGDGGKMRKRAKKIGGSEGDECGIKGGLVVDAVVATDEDGGGDDMEHLLKKKVKSGEEESGEKRVGTKKRKARIHDVDYVGGELVEEEEEEEEKVKGVKFDGFVELAKKIGGSEGDECGIKGGLAVDAVVATDEDGGGDDVEHLLKKKVKGESRKGKRGGCCGRNGDQENVGDAAIATGDDGDDGDVEHLNVGKRVKNNEKIGKNKVKKVKKIKLRQ